MRIEQLQYLLEVDRCKSMKLAGEKLYVSYQAINVAIHQLEEELNTSLVIRTNRGTFLTEDGFEVARFAQEFSDAWEEVKHRLAQAREHTGDTFAIYTTEALYDAQLKPLILYFLKDNPAIDVRIVDPLLSSAEILHTLEDDTAKNIALLLITPDDKVERPEAIEQLHLCKFSLCVVTNQKSLLAKRKTVSLSELASYPVFSYYSNYFGSDLTMELFKKYCPDQNITALSGISIATMDFLIEKDMAVGLRYLPKKSINDAFSHASNHRFIPVTENENYSLVCFYNRNNYPKDILNWLKEAY